MTPDNYRSLNTAKKGFLCEKIKKNVEEPPKEDQKMHKNLMRKGRLNPELSAFVEHNKVVFQRNVIRHRVT